MEQKIKSIIRIKISLFILLTWICYFNIVMRNFNTFSDNKCIHNTKLIIINYRILGKYKNDNDSQIVGLKENTSINAEYGKKNMSKKKNGSNRKNEKSNRKLLNKAHYYTEVIDYNNGMFDGKNFHFEKKWLRKKDYDDSLEKQRRISHISLKKIKFRSYGFAVVIFFLFFLFGIGMPILHGLGPLKDMLKSVENLIDAKKHYFYLMLFAFIIIVLGVTLIMTIPKILRNNEKYRRIKLMNE
ncbi:fam-m protein [Plasmodium malariae]|uniref:Fam-m protein n=1 Tax=Plasmodium malariae TaxID=5858 RepID=A0A1D3JHL4_PLAMA|nr:fam-m protein [Plasmodium malariae]SBT85896.1 fam-m protein [Plasmodium malariae]